MEKNYTKQAKMGHNAENSQSPSLFNHPIVLLVFSVLLLTLGSWWAFKQAPKADAYTAPTLQDKLLYPIETNAFQRLAKIPSRLNDVYSLANSKKVWAVGGEGLIIYSDNGGVHWQKQNFPEETSKPSQQPAKQSFLNFFINNAHAVKSSKEIISNNIQSIPNKKAPLILNPVLDKIKSVPIKKPSIVDNNIRSISNSLTKQISNKSPTTPNILPNKTKPVKTTNTIQPDIKKPNPASQTEPIPELHSIFFIDEQHGWAVGDKGTLINTIDGGENWNKQKTDALDLVKSSLKSVYFSDQQHGWVAGSQGTILQTINGGQNWQKQTIDFSGTLTDIHFTDSLHGWAVSIDDTIFNTLDGGKSWIKQKENTLAWLESVHFSDLKHGWAVGSQGSQDAEGIILYTEDGGKNWLKQMTTTPESLSDIHFIDNQHGWAVGKNGIILKTKNGGGSWLKQQTGTTDRLTAVHFSDINNGWVVGEYGTLLNTKNGGISWTNQVAEGTRQLNSIHFPDKQHGWIVGKNGTVLHTPDSGLSWLQQPTGTLEHLSNVYFYDKQYGWAVGYLGTILNTKNGGKNWIQQHADTSERLDDVTFSDKLHGWVVGKNGLVLTTENGGKRWTKQKTDTSAHLFAVDFPDKQHGWAVGYYGMIISTQNGGLSWAKQTTGTSEWLTAVHFYDKQQGWAVGRKGTILNTLDGGLNWVKQNSGTSELLTAVHFTDNKQGWAVGKNGTVLNTLNGGEDWIKQDPDTPVWLTAVHFSDTQFGWAVGLNTILKTNNAGKHWSSPDYKQYPAGWYYLLCALALFLGYRAFKSPQLKTDNQETITDLLASDRPLQSGDPDPLGFNEIAHGLSRFLRNPRTEPPLTLAITGPWGSGKSSLMNLLFDDLNHHGFSTVWFNAWHHQKGEQLLASLFANIRSQAIPSWFAFNNFCPSGLIFRLRLLKRRSRQHLLLLMLLVFAFSAIAAFIFSGNGHLDQVNVFIDAQLSNLSSRVKLLTGIFTSITTFAALLFGLSKTMQSFALNPLKLMTLHNGTGKKMASVDPSARYQFAREFKNVTASLDLGRMIIFIDDLDRCGKDNVLELLEAINFLVSSGDCYIILGMAPEWVKICVGLGFKELAEESYAELNNGQQTDPAEHRRYFATQYLEKMINIEIPVPILDKEKVHLLTMPKKPQIMLTAYDSYYHNFIQFFKLNKSWIALLAFALWGAYIGTAHLALPKQQKNPSPQVIAKWPANDLSLLTSINDGQLINTVQAKKPGVEDKNNTQNTDLQWSLTASQKALNNGIVIKSLGNGKIDLILKQIDKKITPENITDKSKPNSTTVSIPNAIQYPIDRDSKDFVASAENAISWPHYIPFFVSVILLFSGLELLFRKPGRIVKDSKSFREAMTLWQPYLFLSKQSPRTIKRFLNHLRYMAMRYRPDDTAENFWQKIKGEQINEAVTPEQFSEPALVALSILHYIHKSWVIDPYKFSLVNQLKFAELVKDLSFDNESMASQKQLIQELTKTVQTHKSLFQVESLASETQRKMFLNAQGIQVSNKKSNVA